VGGVESGGGVRDDVVDPIAREAEQEFMGSSQRRQPESPFYHYSKCGRHRRDPADGGTSGCTPSASPRPRRR